jgi:hypothetical protein
MRGWRLFVGDMNGVKELPVIGWYFEKGSPVLWYLTEEGPQGTARSFAQYGEVVEIVSPSITSDDTTIKQSVFASLYGSTPEYIRHLKDCVTHTKTCKTDYDRCNHSGHWESVETVMKYLKKVEKWFKDTDFDKWSKQ